MNSPRVVGFPPWDPIKKHLNIDSCGQGAGYKSHPKFRHKERSKSRQITGWDKPHSLFLFSFFILTCLKFWEMSDYSILSSYNCTNIKLRPPEYHCIGCWSFPWTLHPSMNRWDRRLLIRHGPIGVELWCDCRDNRGYQWISVNIKI